MQKLKYLLSRYPECFLLAVVVLSTYTPPFTINSLGILLIVVFAFQLFFKPRVTGIIIGILFFLFNVYLVFALLDEVADFATFGSKAFQLVLVGSAVITLNLTFSLLMLRKYLPAQPQIGSANG